MSSQQLWDTHLALYHLLQLRPGLLAQPTQLAEFPRINMACAPQTKAQMRALLAAGVVQAWDDPRLPTVRGLMRQGLTAQALCSFLLEQVRGKPHIPAVAEDRQQLPA